MVTRSDTIIPKIEKGKIQLKRGFEENFSLFAKINDRTIKIGSYRPATFNEIDGIAVGRITDFSVIKKYWQWENAYVFDNEYVVVIPDAANIIDVIYSTVKNDVNVSLLSTVKTWTPSFQFNHEVITKKK
jgi:hypothetical protein